MSLRARLVVAVVVLASAGLLVADVVTYASLRAFLVRRVDEQLVAARLPVLRAFGAAGIRRPGPGPGPPPGSTTAAVPPGTYAELRRPDGSIESQGTFVDESREGSTPPELDVRLTGARDTYTSEPRGGPSRYRVLVEPFGERTLVVAIPLDEVSSTLRRLVGIEGAVTAGVLAGLAALAWWAVRVGLRPLAHIEETAGAIAAGDLSRRVDEANPKTEVGRLALALNVMLSQIEDAFAERTASEARLRRFVADASHELRTPLTSIRGYSELFRRGADRRPQDLEKAMRRIEDEAARMGVLVDDLLLLARLDQGRPLEREKVDLARLASDATDDARAAEPSRVFTFDSDGPLIVHGDEVRLRQVAANLLSNALVHTPAGSPVDVRVSRVDARAALEVADHGAGVAPQDAGRIFERFYRSEVSRTREHGGAGLGLSIVTAIVQAHGGTVELSPGPDGGARFRVLLPLSIGPANADPSDPSTEPNVTSPT